MNTNKKNAQTTLKEVRDAFWVAPPGPESPWDSSTHTLCSRAPYGKPEPEAFLPGVNDWETLPPETAAKVTKSLFSN